MAPKKKPVKKTIGNQSESKKPAKPKPGKGKKK